ncbi:MAG: 16S rRNA (cytidine(1402)-2'-O)-methyltransferase [Pseudomonadota bacterium]
MAEKTESKRRTPRKTRSAEASVAASQRDSQAIAPGLWLVATPIGNMGDITLRAVEVLRGADVLACEDTRRARQLLSLLAIPLEGRQLIAYHDRNGAAQRPRLLEMLSGGQSVAYVSDAGTPMIADPGYRLVEAAHAAELPVHTAPGASAVAAALTLAGLPTDRFLFAGFLAQKRAARLTALKEIATVKATLVLFESPRRLAELLKDAVAVLGADRQAAVVREITKLHEEVARGSVGELAVMFQDREARGEIVVVVGPPSKIDPLEDQPERLDARLHALLADLSVKDAARTVADEFGLPKRVAYARALELSRDVQ